jgi:hypothetical protein
VPAWGWSWPAAGRWRTGGRCRHWPPTGSRAALAGRVQAGQFRWPPPQRGQQQGTGGGGGRWRWRRAGRRWCRKRGAGRLQAAARAAAIRRVKVRPCFIY